MTTLTVAKEILTQLGGGKFIAMTGAKNLAGDEKSLQFKIGRNSKSVSHVKVELNGLDLYNVTFYSVRAGKVTIKNQVDNIYNDMLQSTFTTNTGLYTSL